MAVKRWIGSTSGDMNVAGNYSPSGVPANSGDSLHFGADMESAPSTNLSTLTAKVLDLVVVEDGVPANMTIGTASAFVELQATAFRYEASNSGITSYFAILNPSTACNVSVESTGSGELNLAGKIDLDNGIHAGNVNLLKDPRFGTNAVATTVADGAVLDGGVIDHTADVTWGTYTLNGATWTAAGNVGAGTIVTGTMTTSGSMTMGVTTCVGGTVNHGSTGAIDTLRLRKAAAFARVEGSYGGWSVTNGIDIEDGARLDLGIDIATSTVIRCMNDGAPAITFPARTTLTLTIAT